ncbi:MULTISPECIES: hypothetical protein [Pseudomonas]|jgi:hypothetical protein|uniref:Uncharacterized protein n=1 Tax=Pseudomonas zeae TaxID=2745510 RepID=A0ABU5BR52_9PSED|nr:MULTISPECIES: hypothetical protein [Pseudomonas]MDX9679183.1 hypothetical protein [Pseudomonas zeae]PIF51606.1 hypothetical protein CLU80_4027 [Pseudomonas sp. 29]
MQWKVAILLLVTSCAGTSQAADLDFSSAADFARMEILLKDDQGAHPDFAQLSVTLTPEATARAKAISREALGQPLNLSINGQHISTTTVHSELGGLLRIVMPRPVAKSLLPTLIE